MNEKIAQIYINNSSFELDRPFSYLIPENLLEMVQIGSRVLVPFGAGNSKIEGYVVDFSDKSEIKNLKKIYSVVDSQPVFNRMLLELAYWMKDEYMCTLIDSLKCIIPSGTAIKTKKIISLNSNIALNVKGPLQLKVINIIKDYGGVIDFDELKKLVGSNIQTLVKNLTDKNVISIVEKLVQTTKDKTLKIVSLKISSDEARVYSENLPQRFSAQKKIIGILIDNELISSADLINFSQTSYSTLNSLYKKGFIDYGEIELSRDPYSNVTYAQSKPLILTYEQKLAFDKITESIGRGNNEKFLIKGVTGSGKTEIYLQTIDFAIKNGGQAIVLVPEIALTPQMVERFKSRFGEKVAVMHSRLSLGERYDQWKKVRDGEVDVVVGARSAIFAPFDKLKLIIIDEEHETSYKSESKPKYHAKVIAEKRSQLEGCTIVLGSATPSVETYFESTSGKYVLLELKNRVNNFDMPKVKIVDMRKELEDGNRSIFSKALFDELSINLENGQQSILFLNRRGYSTFVSCRACGYVVSCPNCNISLTYHSYNNVLMCHYCGHTQRNPSTCPSCSSKYIKYFGIGTQKVEMEIQKLFPNAKTLRMDVDTTSTKFAHQRILDSFKNDGVDILIGTQMIAKGLDFPNVTLVGVISADTSLNIDDYRAGERTFQLMTQVAGRSGRGQIKGRVVIQTYQPDNFSILTAQKHDYDLFYSEEIKIRKALNYPPFNDIVAIIISHNDNNKLKEISSNIYNDIKLAIDSKKITNNCIIFEPTPAPLSKIKQLYRWRIIIKINNSEEIKSILSNIEKKYYDIANISIDINGINML